MGLPLFLIERIGQVGYDEAAGFVVAATTEDEARVYVASPQDADASPEEDRWNNKFAGDEGRDTWLDPNKAEAKQIANDSVFDEPTMVMRDYHNG